MTDSPEQNDGRDFEEEFYTLLKSAGDWAPPAITEVRKDFFDASEGCQSGMASDGTPVLVLTFTPEGVKMCLDAVRYWQDHNCSGAIEIALFMMHAAAETLEPLLEQLPPEVQTFEPFKH